MSLSSFEGLVSLLSSWGWWILPTLLLVSFVLLFLVGRQRHEIENRAIAAAAIPYSIRNAGNLLRAGQLDETEKYLVLNLLELYKSEPFLSHVSDFLPAYVEEIISEQSAFQGTTANFGGNATDQLALNLVNGLAYLSGDKAFLISVGKINKAPNLLVPALLAMFRDIREVIGMGVNEMVSEANEPEFGFDWPRVAFPKKDDGRRDTPNFSRAYDLVRRKQLAAG
jgi:hypothetical protein